MGLETASFVDGLNAANPLAGDNTSQGDDHLRLIKSVLKTTFPNATKVFRFPTTEVKADGSTETATSSDENKTYSCTASSSGVTINLPSAPNPGFLIRVINNNGGAAVTVTRSGSDTINGATSYTISAQYGAADLVYIGSNVWFAIPIGLSLATRTQAGVVEEATEDEVRASTDGKFLDAGHLSSALALVNVSSASTLSWDWATGINFEVTLSQNASIGVPSNAIIGQTRTMLVQGNSSTPRTLTFPATQFNGEVPTLEDITSTKYYLLTIFARATSRFVVSSVIARDG